MNYDDFSLTAAGAAMPLGDGGRYRAATRHLLRDGVVSTNNDYAPGAPHTTLTVASPGWFARGEVTGPSSK